MAPRELSRRYVLGLLGATAGAAIPLACSRSDQASSSGAEFHGGNPYSAPPKGHFNLMPGVTDQIALSFWLDMVLLPGAMFEWSTRKYHYLLADESTSLSADAKTLTYKVRQGLKWSDGKPITAQDVYSTWRSRQVLGHVVFDYVDKYEVADESTVVFHIAKPAPIAQYYLLRGQILSDAVYGEIATAAEPLLAEQEPDSDAVGKLADRLSRMRPDEVTASGPFNFNYDAISNAKLEFAKNKTGYLADKIDFERIVLINGRALEVIPEVLAKNTDFLTNGFTVAADEQFVKQGITILRTPTYFGAALYFNYAKHPEFADKRVRQAIAHAIDRDQNARVTQGKSGKAPKMMAGMSDLLVEKWLTRADQQKLDGYEFDLDKAEQLLTEAGWSRQGSAWQTPEGKPAKYDLFFISSFADWTTSTQNAQSQLNEFGFDITIRGQDDTILNETVDTGGFSLATNGWGSSSNPFPADAYRVSLINHNTPALESDGQQGMAFPMQQATDVVGDIDLEAAVQEADLGASEEDLIPQITRLALAFNELLPAIPLYERYTNSPILPGVRVDGWPDDSDPIYRNSPYADCYATLMLLQGRLTPASEG